MKPHSKLIYFVFVPLLLCAVALNILLSREVVRLRRTIELMKESRQLEAGTRIEQIEAYTLTGELKTVSLDQPSILYVFRPSCGWCRRNEGNLQTLNDSVEGRFRLIAISLDDEGLQEYAGSIPSGFLVLKDLDDQMKAELRLGGTPQTIVVLDQVVAKSWMGAYTGSLQTEVESFFGIELPGLSE